MSCHTALLNYTALGSAVVNNELKTFFILPLIMKKAREYCCCAIPLVNAGIYLTLTEQVFGSLLIGILSVATPSSEYYNFGYLSPYADNTSFKLSVLLRPHLHLRYWLPSALFSPLCSLSDLLVLRR